MTSSEIILAAGGETVLGALLSAYDWSSTAIGPIDTWPGSLVVTTATLLQSPVPIVLLWGERGVMIYNDAYSIFAGARHPQLLGSEVRDGWPEVADFNDNVMRVGLSGGTLSYKDQELVLDRYGGPQQAWMDLDYSPILDDDGKPGGVIAVVIDTTERVLAERRLRESERRARESAERLQMALAAGAIIGTWHWDLSSGLFVVDDAFAAAFGLSPSLDRGALTLEQVIATVHPDDRAELQTAIDEAIAHGGAYAHQYRVKRADGCYYWIEANGRVDRGADGSSLSFQGVLLDVEARRAVEAERDRATEDLRALNDTLELRVVKRTAELMAAEEQLRQSQKLEAVGQLTGGVAHDFNNLLTIIRSSVDFLKRDELAPDRRARYVEAISDTVERAAKLTSQLLAFARRQSLKPQVFDVGARVKDVSDLIRPLMGARITIEVKHASKPCPVEADVSQFETALVNLAVNARDAMEGEGKLVFSVEEVASVPAIRGHAGATGRFIALGACLSNLLDGGIEA